LRAGIGLGASIPMLGLSTYAYGKTEPHWIEITHHDVFLPHLPQEFEGFRIAQISDLHCDEANLPIDLVAACELTTDQNADVIVFTGDFVSHVDPDQTPKLLAPLLEKLHAKEGVFGVMGNHDYWGNRVDVIRSTLQNSPMKELQNEVHIFQRGKAKLYLAGHDDFFYAPPHLQNLADQIPPQSAAILLGHEPDLLIEISKLNAYGLMLAGHSHGGQICLPFGKPLHLPNGGKQFPRGWYSLNSMQLYTNRGLGTIGPPIRIASRPEISVFTLRYTPNEQK
jgi:predicted MPP superfamily phosphohydrolase